MPPDLLLRFSRSNQLSQFMKEFTESLDFILLSAEKVSL